VKTNRVLSFKLLFLANISVSSGLITYNSLAAVFVPGHLLFHLAWIGAFGLSSVLSIFALHAAELAKATRNLLPAPKEKALAYIEPADLFDKWAATLNLKRVSQDFLNSKKSAYNTLHDAKSTDFKNGTPKKIVGYTGSTLREMNRQRLERFAEENGLDFKTAVYDPACDQWVFWVKDTSFKHSRRISIHDLC
jgi:hypothetical protein